MTSLKDEGDTAGICIGVNIPYIQYGLIFNIQYLFDYSTVFNHQNATTANLVTGAFALRSLGRVHSLLVLIVHAVTHKINQAILGKWFKNELSPFSKKGVAKIVLLSDTILKSC